MPIIRIRDPHTLDRISGFPAGVAYLDSSFSVKDFDATGDGVTDDTAAIQAAINEASTRGVSPNVGSFVFLPAGRYLCAEVDLKLHVKLIGEGPSISELRYNGAGGAGTTVVKATAGGFIQFKNLGIVGTSGNSTFSDNCIRVTSGTIDNHSVWRDIQLASCLFNAIEIDTGVAILNWHLQDIRWDSVGGYGIGMETLVGQDPRPCSLTNFTWDNNPPAGAPSPAPGNWGLGILRVRQAGHSTLSYPWAISHGRIEVNQPLITTTYGDFTSTETPSLFYFEHASGAGNDHMISADTIHVGGTNGLAANQAVFHCDDTRLIGSLTNITGISGSGDFVYKDSTSVTNDMSIKGGNLVSTILWAESNIGQSVVVVSRSSAQSISASTQTKFEYNSIQINDNSEWDNTNFKFITKRPGLYVILAKVRMSAIIDGKVLSIRILRGASVLATHQINCLVANINMASVSYVGRLALDDEVTVEVFQSDTVARSSSGSNDFNNLSIARIM